MSFPLNLGDENGCESKTMIAINDNKNDNETVCHGKYVYEFDKIYNAG